jgi:hypothetical protein
MSSTEHDVLFALSTDVSANVYTKQQLHFNILQQYGFWIDVSGVNKDFYKVAIQDETLSALDNNTLYLSNSRDVSGTLIFNSLKNTTIGYLSDVSGDEDISADVYSTSDLSDNNEIMGASSSPGQWLRVGEQILNGVLGAAFTGNYGKDPIEDSNANALVADLSDNYMDDVYTLDNKIASGLAATLQSTDAENGAHEEAIEGLLAQMRDASGNNHDVIKTHFSDLSFNIAYPLFKEQNFWMKVNLTANLNTGSDSNYLDTTDDAQSDGTNGDNLVSKSYKGTESEYKLRVEDLNSTWASAFKGEIHCESDTGNTSTIIDGDLSSNGGHALTSVVVPLLIRFNVDA